MPVQWAGVSLCPTVIAIMRLILMATILLISGQTLLMRLAVWLITLIKRVAGKKISRLPQEHILATS